MAAPHQNHDDQQYQNGLQYAEDGGSQAYDDQQQQQQQQQQAAAASTTAAAGKKKRAYAGQAFDYGSGANVASQNGMYGGANAMGAGNVGLQQQQPQYGQQPIQQQGYPQPAYGAPIDQAVPQYGQPQYDAQAGYQAPQAGYQASQPGYPTSQNNYSAPQNNYPTPQNNYVQPGMAAMTQQFGQMGVNSQQGLQQPMAMPQRLNPLVPVDIGVQGAPFHVTDLDLPPPPLILPPNVSQLDAKPFDIQDSLIE